MEELKRLIELSGYVKVLGPIYAESFLDISQFFIWLSLLLLTVMAFLKIRPISRSLQSIREELNSDYEDSDIAKLIPESGRRYLHWTLLAVTIVFSVFLLAGTLFWFSAMVMAFIADGIKLNRFTAVFVLGSIAMINFSLLWFVTNDANRIARHLNRS